MNRTKYRNGFTNVVIRELMKQDLPLCTVREHQKCVKKGEGCSNRWAGKIPDTIKRCRPVLIRETKVVIEQAR